MNGLMAVLADDQGFAVARGHPSHPQGFLPPAWAVQVREFAHLVHLAVLRSSAQLAPLRHLTPTVEDLDRMVVEVGVFLPAQFKAPKPRYPWLSVPVLTDRDFQHFV